MKPDEFLAKIKESGMSIANQAQMVGEIRMENKVMSIVIQMRKEGFHIPTLAELYKRMTEEGLTNEMERETMRIEIDKRTENAVNARIESTVRKYGYTAFRVLATRHINTRREREKLQQEIEGLLSELPSSKTQ